MYELFVRIETLFLALNTPILLGIGVLLLLVGLVLWLGGSRYSTVIVGLLGAVVGSVAGLLVGQWLSLHLWLCMIVGATVLAAASVLLRNVLILALAVLVIASLSGAGYVVVVLDRIAPEQPETKAEAQSGQSMLIQSFTNMEPSARMQYVDQISKEEGFRERLRAMLDNTWQAVEPHVWKVGLSVLAGGIVAIFLVWLIKKALIALSYSVVGTAAILLGAQTALLGVGVQAVSEIGPRPWVLPGTFLGMAAIGWICQLFFLGPKAKTHAAKEPQESEK
jgi:hypothetical protein